MKRFLLPIIDLSSLLVLAGCDDSSSNSRSVSLAETLGGKTFHADLSAGTTSKAVASDADLEGLYFTFANDATTVEVAAVHEDHSFESETAPVTQNDERNARFESSTGSWTFEIDPESGALSGNHGSQAVSCNRRRLEALVLSMSTRAKNTMGFPTTNPFPSLFMMKRIPAALSAPT